MILVSPSTITVTERGPGYLLAEATKATDLLKPEELVAHFSGLGYLLDYLSTNMTTAKQEKSSTKETGSDWCTYTYPEALRIYRENPSQVRQFSAKDDQLIDPDESGRALTYDVTGGMLDVGRYLDGEPEVFASLVEGLPRGQRVNIVLGNNASAGTTNTWLNKRASRLVRLVDWLEAQNVRVQVTAITSAGTVHLEVDVKQYHEALDLNTIAVVSHTDFFRRLTFRLIEYSKTYDSGYGDASLFDETLARHPELATSDDGVTVVIGSNDDHEIGANFDTLETKLTNLLVNPTTETLGILL